MELIEKLQASTVGFLPDHLGIRFVSVTEDSIEAAIDSPGQQLSTLPGIVHGGTIMAFADTLGAYSTIVNLPDGFGTTTIESKTNFLAAANADVALVGKTEALHRGGRTMVWQTRIYSGDRLVAQTTQTQMVLEPRKQSG
ncbi:MAG: PaaI family thioesterase [Gammaproteobacteria bacterium]|nr:PaaI family thioesterase [Gammaproteobacteria bacterium]